ncbi:MAG: hypothetical protein K9L85_01585 [Candidatus Peribacteraceae bacterium]|nr:hypothetical protein [Candidatus Peribacteraceae bacterium]
MKISYLVSALVITVVLLIIAFQNIRTTAAFVMFFSFKSVTMTIPVMLISVLGIAAGVLYTLAIQSAINKKAEELRDELDSQF